MALDIARIHCLLAIAATVEQVPIEHGYQSALRARLSADELKALCDAWLEMETLVKCLREDEKHIRKVKALAAGRRRG